MFFRLEESPFMLIGDSLVRPQRSPKSMSILPNLLRSLLLTSIFSFLAPVFLIGTILASLVLLGYVPGLEVFGKIGVEQVAQFLKVFGSASALRGLVIIGVVCSLVGVLFDAYTFYRYQNLRE
jgi:type III secretory pathway component EscU